MFYISLFVIIALLVYLFAFDKCKQYKPIIDYLEKQNKLMNGTVDVQQVALANLKQFDLFNQYLNFLETSSIKFSVIDTTVAEGYFRNYHKRRDTIATSSDNVVRNLMINKDTTQAVLIPLDSLLIAIIQSYRSDFNIIDTATWRNKGLYVYFSYYGKMGYLNSTNKPVNKNLSSVLVEMAKDTSLNTPDEWQIIKGHIYNYGDLKPPKIISNAQIELQ